MHLDCVRGHGKEVREASGWEGNLLGAAFEEVSATGSPGRARQGSWKPARIVYLLTRYSQPHPCPGPLGSEGVGRSSGGREPREEGGQDHSPRPHPGIRCPSYASALEKHFGLPAAVHFDLQIRSGSAAQRMASRIPPLPVFSKGSETSDLPQNLHFSSKQTPSTMRTAWHLAGRTNWKLAIFGLNCTVSSI